MTADDPQVTLSLSDLQAILFLVRIPPLKYGANEDRYKAIYARVRQMADSAYQVSTTSHRAMRGDAVAEWIKRRRNQWIQQEWLDDLLDDYRAHADYGLDLSEDVPEPP